MPSRCLAQGPGMFCGGIGVELRVPWQGHGVLLHKGGAVQVRRRTDVLRRPGHVSPTLAVLWRAAPRLRLRNRSAGSGDATRTGPVDGVLATGRGRGWGWHAAQGNASGVTAPDV